MFRSYLCPECGNLHDIGDDCPQLRSIVPARMPEQSNAEALAGGPSVPGDSLRKICELAERAIMFIGYNNLIMAEIQLEKIRIICSNENSVT